MMFTQHDLDPVELFYEVEDAFGVRIPEKEYVRIKTTNDLIEVVDGLCGADSKVDNPCLTARAFFDLRSKLVDLLPLRRQEIRPSSSLESLIPKDRRHCVWKSLGEGGVALPSLSMRGIHSILTFLAVLVPSIYVLTVFAEQYDHRFWMNGLWQTGVLMLLMAALIATGSIPWPWATRIPAPYLTVGDVATHLACLDVEGRSSAQLSRDEVAHNVRMVIACQLGIPLEGFDDHAVIETLI